MRKGPVPGEQEVGVALRKVLGSYNGMTVGCEEVGGRPAEGGGGRFLTTHWSAVVLAGRREAMGSMEALEWLCRAYWQPVYTFIRRRGHDIEPARDLTQAFFLKLLDKGYLADADRTRGRFRTFLLTAVTRFLANEYDRGTALKRGGGHCIVSLELLEQEEEAGVAWDPADRRTPESAYDERWAETLLSRVLDRLREEFDGAGRTGRFEVLKEFLTDDRGSMSYAEAASRLGVTESAVKSGIYRLRQRYGELVREEIAQTVAKPEEIEPEVRYLLEVLGG